MSAFLATTCHVSPDRMRAARHCLHFLGGDADDAWADARVEIVLTRKTWELADDFSGPCGILRRDDLTVAADASIYARELLRADLAAAGVRAGGTTPAHLIAAAYRAWHERLGDHLIGDFSFAIWDGARRRLLVARDPAGSRPLFFAEVPRCGVVVASSARAVVELLGRGTVLNLATLGAQVAGLPWALGRDTAYDDVEALPPGHVLIAEGDRVRIERFWKPPLAPSPDPMRADDAQAALRELIATAVADRCGADRTTVWMSGGWDSTAVFGAGQSMLARDERRRLRPVSISYPRNDPGYEDGWIQSVAAYWNVDVQWLHSADIPLLDGLEQRAAETDEPPAHLYELWNRALARATRAAGARIALDGSGGDQLFQVSDIVLADLLRDGRWLAAVRHTRARGHGWRHLVRLGVAPLLPTTLLNTAERVLGRDLPRHYLERRVASWMRRDFVDAYQLRERDLDVLTSVRGESFAHNESMLFLTLPMWSWGASYMHGPLLQEGVEPRSPLLDRRVVEFALSRPVAERASARETKILLRRAMRGLLPEHVLEPRPHRTGTTVGFSRMRMREAYPRLVARLFAQPLRLADYGMVEPSILRDEADRVCAGQADEFARVNLFHAMKVEFWLRGLEARSAAAAAARASSASTSRQFVASCAGQSPAIVHRSGYVHEA
ncbi:MAG TPA: asparagine synthase-related protein [Gemmatimonadaceae bacterium]|nr:asparagine synthase-related protein [Gemmatimonadaceae bacterium]